MEKVHFTGGADMGHRKDNPQEEVRRAAQHALASLGKVYELFNAFASGKTQKQWSRVEPLAVMAQVYGDLAPCYIELKQALQ